MINVFIGPLMLDDQQEIADLTRQYIQSRYIAGAKTHAWLKLIFYPAQN